ncbi:MAG: hypothetical protein RIR14_1727, partial [Pseudomonadota bacterium]
TLKAGSPPFGLSDVSVSFIKAAFPAWPLPRPMAIMGAEQGRNA